MIKQKKGFTFIFAAWAAIALFNAAAFARASVPAKVEIQSLTIRKIFQRTPEGFLSYRNLQQGTDVLFIGRASQVRLPYMDSNAFPFPTVLGTELTEFNSIIEAKSGGNFDLPQVRFYIDSMVSEPINLRPTIPRKKEGILMTGKVRLRGKAEIYAERMPGIPWLPVAVDNDFDLIGTYTAHFRQFAGSDRRTAKFEFVTYNLAQVE